MSILPSPAAEERPPSQKSPAGAYKVGDRDNRPWGHYIVTGTGKTADGEEYCEKKIVIEPMQILSLQSHNLRRETWTVKRGTLTALRDGTRAELSAGESIHIPAGSLHCMANLDEENCIVEERQEGICREDDIKRYVDIYSRGTEASASSQALRSLAAYHAILVDMNTIKVNRKHGIAH